MILSLLWIYGWVLNSDLKTSHFVLGVYFRWKLKTLSLSIRWVIPIYALWNFLLNFINSCWIGTSGCGVVWILNVIVSVSWCQLQMGIYLSTPKTEKLSEDGENSRLRFGLSSMQGWRATMEDAVSSLSNLFCPRFHLIIAYALIVCMSNYCICLI